jgi:hypothetical protein
MNCQVKDKLVIQLAALNGKLNLLSPDLVHGDEERAEVQQQRETLYAEIHSETSGESWLYRRISATTEFGIGAR